eukprot:COSAG06_NODE_3552_length_5197_cov_15.188309_7_plen_62_part_00
MKSSVESLLAGIGIASYHYAGDKACCVRARVESVAPTCNSLSSVGVWLDPLCELLLAALAG